MLFNLEWILLRQYREILDQEKEFWTIRSNINWLNFGDRNTYFFFNQWSIISVELIGLLAFLITMKIGFLIIIWFYNNSMTIFLQNLPTKKFSLSKRAALWSFQLSYYPKSIFWFRSYSFPKEISKALFEMGPYKAPGPDGFHPVFFFNKKKLGFTGISNYFLCSVYISHRDRSRLVKLY